MKHFFRGLILGICVVVVGAHLVKQVSAVPGELVITGTSTTLTGDITSARLLDQANTDYFIDPAASGTSLVTAGKVAIATTSATENFTISGNIGFTGGGKIKDNAGQLQLQAGSASGQAAVTVDSNTQLTVESNLSNSYTQTTNSRCNSSDTNCSQVVNVPVYQTVTMTGGTLTAPAWSSSIS